MKQWKVGIIGATGMVIRGFRLSLWQPPLVRLARPMKQPLAAVGQ